MWNKDKSASLSLPRSKRVRGYEVRRLPLGALLTALDAVRDVPEALCQAAFPGVDAERAMLRLSRLDRATALTALLRAASAAPRALVRLTAALTETDEQRLLADPLLGADGLCELLLAWLEVNDVANFGKAAGRLIGRIKALAASAGCNG